MNSLLDDNRINLIGEFSDKDIENESVAGAIYFR